jgi:hypothetical protein
MLEVNPITVSGCQNGYPKKKTKFFLSFRYGTAIYICPYFQKHPALKKQRHHPESVQNPFFSPENSFIVKM